MDNNVLADCRQLYSLMRRFWLRLSGRLTNALLQENLNMPQYNALVVIDQTGEITMGNLAKRLRVTMGAATNIVDRLLKAKYVVRERSDTDRRVVNVRLTPEGENILRESAEGFIGYASGILAQIAPEDRQVFLATYARITEISEMEVGEGSSKAESTGKITTAPPDAGPA